MLKIARPYTPALVEPDCWECGKLISRQAQKLESGSTAFKSYSLFSHRSNLDGSRWKLPRNFRQFLRWNCHGTWNIYVRHYLGAYCDIQICPRELDPFIG